MLLNCGVGEDSLRVPWTARRSNQYILKEIDPEYLLEGLRTDVEAEAPILWPHDAKNWLLGKDLDPGKDWRQEKKGTTENEMVEWHHRLNGHEFEQALGVSDGQGSLASMGSQRVVRDWATELNWTALMMRFKYTLTNMWRLTISVLLQKYSSVLHCICIKKCVTHRLKDTNVKCTHRPAHTTRRLRGDWAKYLTAEHCQCIPVAVKGPAVRVSQSCCLQQVVHSNTVSETLGQAALISASRQDQVTLLNTDRQGSGGTPQYYYRDMGSSGTHEC